ncbi:hypothetical protein GPECTOR_10g1117 [Gonium pectorale]|uniref:Ribonuclease H n=1 Tax=Gonium pectorale TaxID=33097 RepID=A0A150GQM9_GONPE|nr:hypothetical protein GPECTOR_10g1117 [Gonium pectorale]|eukprot:KXZ52094.1 hypothetical protein GPECTOR_10g1117 [Gonium pectorale]
MGKWYAVRVGRRPGVYASWDEVKELVLGYPGAKHKSFKSRSEAEAYLDDGPSAGSSGGKRRRDDSDGGYDDGRHQPSRRSSYDDYPPAASARPAPRAVPLASRQPNVVQPYLGTLIVEASARYNVSSHGAQAYGRGVGTGVGNGGGGSRGSDRGCGSGRFDAKVEGPLQPIRGDILYQLEFDGAARGNPGEAGCGAVLRRESDGVVACRLRKYMGSPFTNNEAEYTALLEGLKMASRLGVRRLEIRGDSKLVVQQVLGQWRINKDHLATLCSKVQDELRQFAYTNVKHIPREWNSDADKLSNDAIDLAYR